jgi:hypothetical protein
MNSGCDLADGRQQSHVLGTFVELEVADQGAERVAPVESELVLVDLLPERTLGELGRRIEVGLQLLPAHVEHPDLESLGGLAVHDELVQASPRGFELLEILVVKDLVDLLREHLVDYGDPRVDRLHHALLDDRAGVEDLLDEVLDQVLRPLAL